MKARKRKGGVATKGLFRDVALFAGLAAIASGYAYVRIEGTLAGYRLSAAQGEQQELLREREALKLELATRRAAGRIEAAARERLGMVDPGPGDIIPVPEAPARTTVASSGSAP